MNNIINVNEIKENESKGSGNFGCQNKLHSCTWGVRALAVGIYGVYGVLQAYVSRCRCQQI